MAKQKASTKATPAPKQPVVVKRQRTDISDSYRQSKKAKISKTDTFRPTRTTAIKRESQDCDICAETKPIYRNFPSLPTCLHDATVCSNCYERHFVTKINENRELGWTACTCPLCGEKVEPKDAQGVLPRHLSRELDTTIKNVGKHAAQNWIWCPGLNRGRGQLHNLGSGNKVICHYCSTKTCYKHQCVWHEQFTCDEFDQIGDHDANTAKSIEEIQRTTKPCPHCKTRIKKDGGCNHMICTGCNKHWLWDTVSFDGEQVATTAEFRGGPAHNNPLGGAARQAVEQVMQFENARVDDARAPIGPPAARIPPRLTVQPVPRNILMTTVGRLAGFFRAIPPNRQTPSRPPSVLENAAEARAALTRTQHGVHEQRIREASRLLQRVQRTNENALTRLIGLGSQIRQQDFPVSNMRSTQNSSARQRQSPARPRGQDQSRTRRRAAPDPPLIDLDESDIEITTVGRRDERHIQRNPARRGRMNSRSEVIDLTEGAVIIDLTGED